MLLGNWRSFKAKALVDHALETVLFARKTEDCFLELWVQNLSEKILPRVRAESQ